MYCFVVGAAYNGNLRSFLITPGTQLNTNLHENVHENIHENLNEKSFQIVILKNSINQNNYLTIGYTILVRF